MIIADENLEKYWIELLRNKKYEVLSIAETHPQINDSEVASLAQQHRGILITEDKDFGELVFAHGVSGLSIVFLRYDQPEYSQIENALMEIIEKYHHQDTPHFITISKNKIRIRKI
jgi:predicted nuclease of predicted toxin-antitoxin system